MSNTNNTSGGGMGCMGFLVAGLTILFVGLKLAHIVAWPWLWVLAPIWVYALVIAIICAVVFLVTLIIASR